MLSVLQAVSELLTANPCQDHSSNSMKFESHPPPVRYAVSTNSISIYCLVCSGIVYSDVFASIRIASYRSSYSDRIVKTAVRQIAFSTPEQTSNLSSLYQESPNMLRHGSSLSPIFFVQFLCFSVIVDDVGSILPIIMQDFLSYT